MQYSVAYIHPIIYTLYVSSGLLAAFAVRTPAHRALHGAELPRDPRISEVTGWSPEMSSAKPLLVDDLPTIYRNLTI